MFLCGNIASFFFWVGSIVMLALGTSSALAAPSMDAVPLSDDPYLDGDVANDPAWNSALAATGFVQVRPF
ncbi:MAG TPA: hypothetical protein DD646_02905, partial [Acidimicrobiaceae bacterium]|nr:hypothetical protein [Acidimicrobiaceae bacterium]